MNIMFSLVIIMLEQNLSATNCLGVTFCKHYSDKDER